MPYVRETITAGNVKEVREYYTTRYNQKGGSRAPHRDETPAAQEKVNHRNAERRLRGLINTNFRTDDWFIAFRYRQGCRVSPEECRNDAKKLVRELRKVYKKAGAELKYIYVIEHLKRACHIHMILPAVSAIPASVIRKIWLSITEKAKSAYFDPTWSGDFASGLAHYLLKEFDPTHDDYRKPEGGSRFYCSRNLVKPEIVKEIMKRTKIPKQPYIKKGYVLIPQSYHEGVCAFTGYEYRTYTMIRS